jgi:hypothetical protein
MTHDWADTDREAPSRRRVSLRELHEFVLWLLVPSFRLPR